MYINRRGVAVAVLSVALLAGGAYYATGPSYLSNPVVTASVTNCQGKGADAYCTGHWLADNGVIHHGGIDGATRQQVGETVKVREKDDQSATTRLELGAGGWFFRELIAAIPLGLGIALAIYLYARRRRFTTENPDNLPGLASDPIRQSAEPPSETLDDPGRTKVLP